jgi:hypothetical protein
MVTFRTFLLTEAGSNSERQERGLINGVKALVKSNNNEPITIAGISGEVLDAYKKKKSLHGKEPYTDVVLVTTKGEINISCKGPSAPSLAGGGLAGMMEILESDPSFIYRVYKSIIKGYNRVGLKDGKVYPAEKVPDLSIAIPDELKLTLVKGTEAMGGPIDYMYIGPMDNVLDVNTKGFTGQFIPVEKYAKGDLFLRIRKRDLTKSAFPHVPPRIKYTPKVINPRTNLPVILTVATNVPAIKGKNALRLVIDNKPTGKTVPLSN